ncbi:hypothetical protein, partial, partial [Parasitella parasitica]
GGAERKAKPIVDYLLNMNLRVIESPKD